MKNISFKNRAFNWCVATLMVLLPIFTQAQTDTLLFHDFSANCAAPPSGWTIQNLDGSCTWRCASGGITQNNHTSQGCNNAANDWLITPELDFDLLINEYIEISFGTQYSGAPLYIKYSANYPGTGNPGSYTWTTVGTYSGGSGGTLNINNYSGKGYLAIQYTSYGNQTGDAARYTVYYFAVKGSPSIAISTPTATDIDSTSAVLGANVINDGGTTITERGIVWSATNTNPAIGGNDVTKIPVSGGLGIFDTQVTGLPSGTRIYYKGFVSDANKTVYTNVAFFYTLSPEPASYPSSFTATAISKNSIKLDWAQVNDAQGYVILQRIAQAPTGVPADATTYTVNQNITDGQVVGVINSNATTTLTVNGLIQGTRYYYTLFPYNYNLVNNETYNYRTVPTIPVANDSTLGYPPSHGSTIEGVAGTGVVSISSLLNETTVNDTNKGALAWRFSLNDGGPGLSDLDDLPTTVTDITLGQGANNTVTNWSTAIQSAGLFDDSTGTLIKAATITANSIAFTGLNIVAQDDNYRPLSLRLSLRKTAHVDKSRFHFSIDAADVVTKTVYESSQTKPFTNTSDTLKNQIEVVATKLGFVANLATPIEAGAFINQVQVVALDTFNGLDLDFVAPVSVTSVSNNLIAGPRTINAANGMAAFDTVRFLLANPTDTLIATSSGLIDARSNRFVVQNSKKSDIVADGAFVYPQNIHHLNYRDTGAIESTNSLAVFSMYLRDGGKDGDADFVPTELTAVTFNVANSYMLGKVALFANGNKIGEVSTVSSTMQFSGFSVTANDNDSVKLTLQVTFKDLVNDGDRVTFTVTNTTVTDNSLMVAANAGGAVSSSNGDDNKIDILGTKLVFINQPVNVARGAIMYPFPTVRVEDNAGNIDASGRAITMEVAGGSSLNYLSTATVGVIPTKGYAEFGKLIFDVPAIGIQLIARGAGLDSALSQPFDILLPVWFRSAQSGNWSDVSTWEYSTDFGSNWAAAVTTPDYSIHGYITIQTGHTVQMDGTTAEANTIDEVTVETGAVLITPTGGSFKLTVNDAFGDDIIVEGKLLHNNSQSVGGVSIQAPGSILVKKDGIIELASFGDAADWAGNANIYFEDSAIYLHNTSLDNTISAVTMFPNASASQVAIFRVAQNTNFPGSTVNVADALVINGLLSVDANKTFTLGGTGERHLRNGITGVGSVVITDSAKTRITGEAQISGTGIININNAGIFQIAATSHTQLLNNKAINTNNNNNISIAGELNGLANGFSGNAATVIETGAKIITAHPQGMDGLFANTGAKTFDAVADYEFNGTTAQNSGTIAGNAARNIWVKNTAGLSLTNKITVTGTLYMGMGNVITTAANLLTIDNGAMVDNYSATSYINGPVKMWADNTGAVTFPVGKTNYAPVMFTTTGADWATLEYTANNPNVNSYDTSKRGEGLAAVKANEYWTINTSLTGSVEVPYTVNSAASSVDVLNIRVVSWNGTQWVSEGPVARTATTTSVISDKLSHYSIFTIGIDSACTVPAAPAFTTLNVCMGDAANLTATGNGIVRWFASMNDDMPFAVGNTANAGVITVDSIFYTEVKNIGCYSNRVAYPVKINAIPSSPVINGNTQLCYNQPAQLTVNNGGTNLWYNDVNATTPTFTGDVLVSANLTNDTVYYVEKVENGCPSPRTRVDVAVRAQIQNPYSLGAEVCAGNAVAVKATANEDIHWFANTVTTVPFFTGEKYNTNTLFADTTFYLEAFEGNCISQRVPVKVTVFALPAAPVLSQPVICEGNSTPITATATGQVYWYNDNTSTISIDSGNTFTTPLLGNSRSYYASVYDGKCFSPKASTSVSVYTVPANPVFTVVSYTGANQLTAVQTTTVAQNYEWNFGADATPQTTTGVGPHNVKWATQGTKTITLKVWNGLGAVACSTEVQKTLVVGPGLGIEGIEAAKVLVYPNPVNNGELNINLGDVEKATITVTDATGKQIWAGAANSTQTTVNVDGWAAGIYFVNVATQEYNQTVKVTKQ